MSRALRDRNAYYLMDARKSRKRKKDTAGEETTRPWNGCTPKPKQERHAKTALTYLKKHAFWHLAVRLSASKA